MCLSKKKLPREGSTYIILKGAHKGISNIVHHHDDKKAFMIYTGNSWIVNIKP